MTKNQIQKIRNVGAADALSGKSLDAFYEVSLTRHTEALRGIYTGSWKWARVYEREVASGARVSAGTSRYYEALRQNEETK